jgi:hypothetical protein
MPGSPRHPHVLAQPEACLGQIPCQALVGPQTRTLLASAYHHLPLVSALRRTTPSGGLWAAALAALPP